MNFNYGSSSHIPFSSSPSDNDYYDDIEKQAVAQITANNNFLITQNLFNSKDCHGGSTPGHIVINCGWENASRNLFNDYFADNPLFHETMFRRRFQMSRHLFLRFYDAIQRHDNYFVQRRDGAGKLGLSGLQKITVVFRMLAYGLPADSTDEYIKIGESTTIESLKRFCRAVVEVFASRYLRSLDANDVARLLHIGERAFEVLQSRFAIVAGQARFWSKKVLHDIMTTCIIMHNMIIEDERDIDATIEERIEVPVAEVELAGDNDARFQEFLPRHRQIKDREAHMELRNALIEHLWSEYINSEN